MVSSLVNIGLRGAQALFGIVVLGLSVTLLRGHHWGDTPAGLGYGAFVGGLSVIGALIGLAATWFDFLGGLIGLVVDVIVALVNIAGGVVYIIKLGGVKCKATYGDVDNGLKLVGNDWFNGGCQKAAKGVEVCWVEYEYQDDNKKGVDVILGHCKEAQADFVFMFLTTGVVIVCALLVWLRMRRGY